MSDGSPSPLHNSLRPLRTNERELVRTLLSREYPATEIERRLAQAKVQDMSDGGMGSIRFATPDLQDRRFGRVATTAEYVDSDGVLVSVTLNLDDRGDSLEVDFWKVDFSPLVRFPNPRDLTSREIGSASPTISEVAAASPR